MSGAQQLGMVTPGQILQVREYALTTLGMVAEMLTENAGCAVATCVRTLLDGTVSGRHILVLVGTGSSGAAALVAARRLAHWGSQAVILLAEAREALHPTTALQLGITEQCGVRVFESGALLPDADAVIDGLLDLDHTGDPSASTAALIDGVSRLAAPVLAVDVPSGMDASTGKGGFPTVRASATLALVYPAEGLLKPFAQQLVGTLFVADVGLPPTLWQQFEVPAPDFSHSIVVPVMQPPSSPGPASTVQ